MGYYVYRENTYQYFAGYDTDGKPTWVSADGLEPAIEYGTYAEADDVSSVLWNAGFITEVDIVSGERIKDEW